MIFDLALDFSAAISAMPKDHPRHRILMLLEEAVRRDIHFIDRHPTTMFQCMWNTCWWYDCPDAEEHYVEPEGGWGHSGQPWGHLTAKLCDLLEHWLNQSAAVRPGIRWVRCLRPPYLPSGSAQRAVLRGHRRLVTSVSFSGHRERIVSGSYDGSIRVWDLITGQEMTRFCLWAEIAVLSVAFAPSGDRIVVGADLTSEVTVWDSDSGKMLQYLPGHEGHRVFSVAYDPSGHLIASGAQDQTVRVWDTETGREVHCMRGHEGEVRSVAFSPDGRRIVSGAEKRAEFSRSGHDDNCELRDNTIRVWDVATGQFLHSLRSPEENVWSVAYSPDGRRIVAGCGDRTLRVCDSETGEELRCLRGHQGHVWSVAFSPNGQRIVSGAEDTTIRVWDAESGLEICCLHGHSYGVTTVAWAPVELESHQIPLDDRIASGSGDGTIRVWDVPKHSSRYRNRGHQGKITGVIFSPDGRSVISCSEDHTVRVWDAQSGRETSVFRGHQDAVVGVICLPDGQRVVSWSKDTTVQCWDIRNGVELHCLRGHGEPVTVVDVAPCGSRIASGSKDATVRVWDLETGSQKLCLDDCDDEVDYVGFFPSGHRVAAAAWGVAYVWNADTGECLKKSSDDQTFFAIDKVITLPKDDRLPFHLVVANNERLVEDVRTERPVAWIVESLENIIASPKARAWAGSINEHICIAKLEDSTFDGNQNKRPNAN